MNCCLWIDFDVAAAGGAVADDAYLGGDARHGVGVADDAHLLALRRLEHGKGVDDRLEAVVIKGAEAFVDEEVLEGDVSGRQCRESQCQPQRDDEGLAA